MQTPYQRAVQLFGHKLIDKTLNDLIESNRELVADNVLEYYREYIESFPLVSGKYHKSKYPRIKSEAEAKRTMRIEDMYGCRYKDVLAVKYAIIHYMAEVQDLSASSMSDIFRCDHTTIIHARATFRDRLEVRDELAVQAWQKLNEFLKQKNAVGV